MPIFETSVTIECPLDKAYDFLLRPANIALITPPSLGLAFTSAPEVLSLGSKFEFKVQAYGQVQTMLHEITHLQPGALITEQQIKGLLKRWVHEHRFETTPAGLTVVTDRIDFDPPSGLIGLLFNAKKIQESLEDGYYHRHQQLKKLLATGS
jgi:ligand-binding SRPBCC domain-containing protein